MGNYWASFIKTSGEAVMTFLAEQWWGFNGEAVVGFFWRSGGWVSLVEQWRGFSGRAVVGIPWCSSDGASLVEQW